MVDRGSAGDWHSFRMKSGGIASSESWRVDVVASNIRFGKNHAARKIYKKADVWLAKEYHLAPVIRVVKKQSKA